MSEATKDRMVIVCPSCGFRNVFCQSYRYHAGHADQGFLYNDAGNLTLIWSAFDPAYIAIVGERNPWALFPEQQQRLEDALLPAPSGGRFRFENPARCEKCGSPISGSITHEILYVVYEGSLNADLRPDGQHLSRYLR